MYKLLITAWISDNSVHQIIESFDTPDMADESFDLIVEAGDGNTGMISRKVIKLYNNKGGY